MPPPDVPVVVAPPLELPCVAAVPAASPEPPPDPQADNSVITSPNPSGAEILCNIECDPCSTNPVWHL
jgi:hypothetical protein